jgi:C1A family cysteine protease
VHLHRAVEVSIESSFSRRTGPHVHGVDDRLCGRFWATGNDSESESDAVVEEQTDLLPNVSASDLKSSLGYSNV